MPPAEAKSKKKKGKFGFKGLVNKRKNKKTAPNGSAQSVSHADADDSTIYSVAIDSSAAKSQANSVVDSVKTPLGDPIHVILLLMDPKTRRFELLQLEFDSSSAKVNDIFAQISISATEPSLKSQKYENLTNLKGEDLEGAKDIAKYIDSAGIIIAVPSTTEEKGEKIVKMASPILTNPKVHAMLVSSGLEISDLPDPAERITRKARSPPIAPTDSVSVPSSPLKEEVIPSPVPAPSPSPPPSEPKPPKKQSPIIVMAALAIFAHLILKVHVHYTSPLGPGDVLSPGRSRGSCGLTRFNPSVDCEPSVITMGEDGVLTVTKGEEVVYQLEGTFCDSGDAECVPGLSIGEDGRLKLNGARGKVVTKPVADLTPWPFSEDVTVTKNLF